MYHLKRAPTQIELVYHSQQAYNLSTTLTNVIQLLSDLLLEISFSAMTVIIFTLNEKIKIKKHSQNFLHLLVMVTKATATDYIICYLQGSISVDTRDFLKGSDTFFLYLQHQYNIDTSS